MSMVATYREYVSMKWESIDMFVGWQVWRTNIIVAPNRSVVNVA